MKKDEIEQLFESMQNQLDIYEPSVNHEARFLEKLQHCTAHSVFVVFMALYVSMSG